MFGRIRDVCQVGGVTEAEDPVPEPMPPSMRSIVDYGHMSYRWQWQVIGAR